MEIKQYYQNKYVRSRMMEFLGGQNSTKATAIFISQCDRCTYDDMTLYRPSDLTGLLNRELDVARSLWDDRSLLIDIDMEYVNFDFLGEPYLDPQRTFQLQEPVLKAAKEVLAEHGIVPMCLLSGRGYHLVWRISRNSSAFRHLVDLGRVPSHLQAHYAKPHSPLGKPVAPALYKAFSGLGLLMEYLACKIQRRAQPHCHLPIELTAVAPGPQERGREIISLDISEYGDPLNTRLLRIPFSVYRKPWEAKRIQDEYTLSRIPVMFLIPIQQGDLTNNLHLRTEAGEVAELARQSSTFIPAQGSSTLNLIKDYLSSKLHNFHNEFYSVEPEPPQSWNDTYDRAELFELPPCAQKILSEPNDLLLRPEGIRHLVRSLMSLGWHPRHIAGLIRSKYERDHGWGYLWYTYDAATRADSYTRIFAGMFFTNHDDLIDFNCTSTREKGLCPSEAHSCSLDQLRNNLLARRET
jgi:hypothetical protein